MAKSVRKGESDQRNVTLGSQRSNESESFPPHLRFPCCLCSDSLEIKIAKTGKPYCTCLTCGIQIFFRGKTGILRLRALLNSGDSAKPNDPGILQGLILRNRIVHLKAQKAELEGKQGLMIRDPDLANLISAVD